MAQGCDYLGLDGSARMIGECRRKFRGDPRARFAVGDAVALPFPSERFDAVVCAGVIDRVVRPESAIAEMGRVLRPGGILVLSVPNLLSPYGFWRSHVFYRAAGVLKRLVASLHPRLREPHLTWAARLWTPRAAIRAVRRAVGDVEGVAYYHFAVLPFPLDLRFPSLALRLAPRLEGLREGRLRWLGAGFVLKVRKRS
jgi:SAM-dependent methyltransferase